MKEFIEKLVGRLEEEKKKAQCEGSLSFAMGFKVAIKIVKKLAEEYFANTPQKSEGGWIPVTERLPEHNQSVIFTDTNGEVEAGIYDANKNWCVNDAYYPNAFNFVAWQPLPEAYRSEKYENAEWRDSVMKHFTSVE